MQMSTSVGTVFSYSKKREFEQKTQPLAWLADLFHSRLQTVKDVDLYLMESEVQKAEGKLEGY